MKRQLLLIAMTVAAAGAVAQPNTTAGLATQPNTTADADSIRQLFTLDEVEVLSTRLGRQAGQTVTSLQGHQLREVNKGQNLPYLLQSTPSLVVTSDDGLGVGYADFRIRGTSSNRINMTINGVPLNDAESQGVFWVNMTDMAASMRSVDVQRGIGTSTNGAAAFGASVNMLLGEASVRPYAELTFNGGSYNTFRESVKAGTGLMKHGFALDARYSKVNSKGYVEHGTSDLYSYFFSAGWYADRTMLKLLAFGGGETTGIAWDGIDPDTWRDAPRTNRSGLYVDADGTVKYWDHHTDNYWQNHYQLHFTHLFNPRWNMSAALYTTHGNGYTEQVKRGKHAAYGLSNYVDANGSTVKRSYLVRRKHMLNDFSGAVVSANYSAPRVDATVGGAASYYDGKHKGNIIKMINPDYPDFVDPDNDYYRSYATKLDANVYAKGEWRPVGGLKLYADLQYRYIDYRINGIVDDDNLSTIDMGKKYHFFNPKAGVRYTRKGHEVYGTFAIANREPVRKNFTEAGPNERPTAERLYDTEVGYCYRHDIFHVGANLYWMQYDNQLVTSGKIGSTGSALTVNVKDSYRAGIELMGGVQIGRHLTWDVNVTLSRNKIRNHTDWVDRYELVTQSDGTQELTWQEQVQVNYGTVDIAMSPGITAGSTLVYHRAGFVAQLQTNYVGSQQLDNTGNEASRLPAYMVSNLHMRYTFSLNRRMLKSIELSLAFNNLFNAHYVSNGWVYSYFNSSANPELSPRTQLYEIDHDASGYVGYYAQAPFNVHGGITVRF